MQLRPVGFAAVAFVCASAEASAQQMPVVAPQRQIHGSFSLQAIYDSNFARSSDALARTRGIEKREYTLRPQVELDVVQPIAQQLIYVRGTAGYDFHRHNPRLDRPRADLQGGVVSTLGMCQASAFANYRASLSDLGTVDDPGVKNLVQSYSTAAGVQCGRPAGIFGSAVVQRTENENSALTQKPADSSVESLTTIVGYGNPTLGRLGIGFSYANTEFPNRIIPTRPIGDGFFTQSYTVSVERPVGQRLTLQAVAGRTMVKREFAPPGVDQKFTSTTYSASGTYKVGNRLTLDLIGSKAVTPTQRAGKLYDIAKSFEARARYALGSRYTITVGQALDDIKSNVDTNLLRPVVTTSRTYSTFAAIRYRQSERLGATVDVRYEDRNTNLPDFDYTAVRVGLSAHIGF